MTRPRWLRPRAALRVGRLLARALFALARLELVIRRRPLPRLCGDAGIRFAGFTAAEQPEQALPRSVAEVRIAVEAALRVWPWGRDRRCLRRGLVLGRLIAALRPVLHLEVTRASPLAVHAVLVAHGQRLDLGVLDPSSAAEVEVVW
jgi:hypothetical protein